MRISSRASGVAIALRSVPANAGGLLDATICCSRLSSISAGVGGPAAVVVGGTGCPVAGEEASAGCCEPEEAAAAGVGVRDGGVGRLSEAIF